MKKIVLVVVLLCPFLSTFHAEGQDEKKLQMTVADQAFYRVITDFNLFRPLGWRPPDKSPKYELMATKVPADGLAKALIRENRSNRTYYVSVGDQLERAEVEKIGVNKVSLKLDGKTISLSSPSVLFLGEVGGSKGRGKDNRGQEDKENKERGKGKDGRGKGSKGEGKNRKKSGGKGSTRQEVEGWSGYFRNASRQQIIDAVRSEKFRGLPEETRREIGTVAREYLSEKEE